jgi:predicted short-subunit dehydrogenase-like oxidoreductase (DUF2520 family)
MEIVLVGAGKLATNLGKALRRCGHNVAQVYSRTMESAQALALITRATPLTRLDAVTTEADLYIVSVKDSAVAQLVKELCKGREDKIFLHTAGSLPVSVFEGAATHYGVLYPMQTFSKEKEVDFAGIPCFIEANDELSHRVIAGLAHELSRQVYELSSADRKYLHLAAVFACNFANHCYTLSHDILESHGIPFSVMLPLIDETAEKVHLLKPADAQTGPAVRYDENVIGRQADLLKDNPLLKDIYEMMSRSIHQKAENKNNEKKEGND